MGSSAETRKGLATFFTRSQLLRTRLYIYKYISLSLCILRKKTTKQTRYINLKCCTCYAHHMPESAGYSVLDKSMGKTGGDEVQVLEEMRSIVPHFTQYNNYCMSR